MKVVNNLFNRQAGVALVLVLWITVLLTIMAGAFTLTLQREAKLVGNLKARSEANAFAEAGLNYAMLMMSVNDPKSVWKADRSTHELPFYNASITIQIGDERGKIDLNLAGRDLLLKMFTSVDLDFDTADKLTDAIIDWRDKNDDESDNGAEAKDYKHQDLPYVPRNGPFQTIEELQFVLGMTPQLFKKVEPMLTVYSHSASVDKKKAPDAVLKALEMQVGDDAFGTKSSGADSSNAGAPVSASVDPADAIDPETGISTVAEVTDTDSENANNSDGSAVSAGGTYSIDAAATVPYGYTGRIRVLVRRGGPGAFTILSWKYITAPSTPFADDISAKDTRYSIN